LLRGREPPHQQLVAVDALVGRLDPPAVDEPQPLRLVAPQQGLLDDRVAGRLDDPGAVAIGPQVEDRQHPAVAPVLVVTVAGDAVPVEQLTSPTDDRLVGLDLERVRRRR
jgi:hypothetical protein